MTSCIKCGKESDHSICGACADALLNTMSIEDQMAHALVGLDAIKGLTNLNERLVKYKEKLKGVRDI